MCGIAGIADFKRNVVSVETLNKMLAAQFHRGPNDQGIYHNEHVCMGMRRLAIIALENGAQPCFSNNERFALVFNGEIYNYQELRRELISQGYRFVTDSDAEVIVNLYQRDGLDFYNQLEGMFAIAIYDKIEDSFLLARDYTGKKPLFYAFHDGVLSFASELKALLEQKNIKRKINLPALDYFLRYRVVPGDQSIFESVQKVPPGSTIVFNARGQTQQHHWRVDYKSDEAPSLDDWVDEIDAALNQAISKRLSAEVPVGTMLSGGLDSSLVTAIACKQQKRKLNTFAVGFHEADYSELDYARRLAEDLGTEHHSYIINRDEALDAAHKMVSHFGEPFAFPSSIACYFMYFLARQNVTVVLGGDGADELFGGYARYEFAGCYPNFPSNAILPRKVDIPGRDWSPNTFSTFYLSLLTDGLGLKQRRQLYSPMFKKHLTDVPSENPSFRKAPILAAMEYDFNHWMKEAQLVKIDTASMANSLEVRSPFLDKQVIAIGSKLPHRYKIQKEQRKFLLYTLAKRYLPDYIARRKKQELAVPLEKWIFSSIKEKIFEVILSDRALSRGYFDADQLRSFVKEAQEEDSYMLWTLYILEKWHEIIADG